MHLAFINLLNDFDANRTYWMEHRANDGQEIFVREMAIAMAQLGHKVDIITKRLIEPIYPDFAQETEGYPGYFDLRIIRIPIEGERYLEHEEIWPHVGLDYVRSIIEYYRNDGSFPEIFSAHYASGGLTASILQDRQHIADIPFVFFGHTLGAVEMDKMVVTPDSIEEIDRRFHYSRRVIAERISMNRAAKNIVFTGQERFDEYSHRAYEGAVDVNDDNRFEVVSPGVNLGIFGHDTSLPRDDEVVEYIVTMFDRDLEPDRRGMRAIINVNGLTRNENLIGLVKAYADSELLQDLANLVIVVPGLEDPLRDYSAAGRNAFEIMEEVLHIINTNNLWGKISAFSLYDQAEMSTLFRFLAPRRSVFVLPSYYEHFGYTNLEAMLAGLPTVATKNGGTSETMFDGDINKTYGILVDPADSYDIGQGIIKLISDRNNWKYYRDMGIQRARERYSWRHSAEKFTYVLQSIIDERKIPEPTVPIPEFFVNAMRIHDITTEQLADLYFEKAEASGRKESGVR
jgi:sucrose-phosphate synthase